MTSLLVALALAAAPAEVPSADGWPLLRRWAAGEELPFTPGDGAKGDAKAGAVSYAARCALCHGEAGRGDGPLAPSMTPRPTDLTGGNVKFRSTPRLARATEADLYRTITVGLRGTAMPPFADLPEAERRALAAFTRGLAPAVPEADPLPTPSTPADLDAPGRLPRGREAFTRLGCVGCHGAAGKGDGAVAAALPPERAVPDLTTNGPKRGHAPAELFRTIATGPGPAAMPAYQGVPPDELWDVLAYTRTLFPRNDPTGPMERLALDVVLASPKPARGAR